MRKYALIIPFILLFVIFHFVSAQIGGNLSNFSPMVALFFCGALYWKKSKLLLPVALLSWIIISPVTSIVHGSPVSASNIIIPLVSFAAISLIGFKLSNKKPWSILVGALGSGILFHLVTNLWCFITDPLYTKDFTGLAQALWTIPPHPQALQPTAFFLRQTCLSTLLFTLLFMAAAYYPRFRLKAKAAKARPETEKKHSAG